MGLIFPEEGADDAVAALAYSEPGPPVDRICSLRMWAASAEMHATQMSKAERVGTAAVTAIPAGGVVGVIVSNVMVMSALNWGHDPE
jgi:hypothetical protein